MFNSFLSFNADDPTDLENYPVLAIQRLAGLWSVGFFDNKAGTVTEAQMLAELCRGVTRKLMDQAVFRQIASRDGSKAEEMLAKQEQPSILNTFDDVVKHVLSVQFELARVAEVERNKLELITPEEPKFKAERILAVLSNVAKRLFGRGSFGFETRGIPNDSAVV